MNHCIVRGLNFLKSLCEECEEFKRKTTIDLGGAGKEAVMTASSQAGEQTEVYISVFLLPIYLKLVSFYLYYFIVNFISCFCQCTFSFTAHPDCCIDVEPLPHPHEEMFWRSCNTNAEYLLQLRASEEGQILL